MTNEESADVNEIRRLLAHYNLSGDEGDMPVDDLFTKEACLEIPGIVFRGIEEIRNFYADRKAQKLEDIANNRSVRHQLTTCGIDITGPTTAKGTTYFLLVRLGKITQMGTYFDQYEKVNGQWRIAYRNVVLHFLIED